MAEEYIEITEEQLNDIARYAIITGLDPNDEKLTKHISKCDCKSCCAAKTMLALFGSRITALGELDDTPVTKH